MELGDTNWYPVLDYFESEVSNEHYENSRQDYFEKLRRDDEAIEDAENRFESRRDEAQRAHTARTTLMAAFLRYGKLGSNTRWSFKSFFPLRTHEGTSADVLIGNQSDGSILLALILPIRATPKTGIEDGLQILETVQDNLGPLGDDIGVDIHSDRVNIAIVVDEGQGRGTGEAIVERKSSEPALERFHVWRVIGPEGEQFDLYTDFPSGREHSHEDPLGERLEDGISVIDSPHSLPDFFYDAHHSQLLEHTVMQMASKHKDSEIPTTHFSHQELRTYYEDTLHGSNSSNRAMKLAERILERWSRMALITSVSESQDKIGDGSQSYRFISQKKNPNSIFDDISEDYEGKSVEFILRIKATQKVIDEYTDEVGTQSALEKFSQ